MAIQGRPARQPIDMEDLLVWTYRDQKADLVIRRGAGLHTLEALADGVEVHGVSACGCASVSRIAELGVRVDRSAPDQGALHPDAETVHRAVMRLDDRVHGLPRSRLVIVNAGRAERPDAMVGEVPRPIPVLNRKGEPSVVFSDAGKRYGTCPVDYQPSATMILTAREEYTAWHAALRLLAMALQHEPKLTRWYPLAPAAPEAPWISA